MLYKQNNSLFGGTYQYKVVLVCAGASYFRSGDMDATQKILDNVSVDNNTSQITLLRRKSFKTQDDLEYALALCKQIKKLPECNVRVESPWISVYTNTEAEALSLANIDESRVKYISAPPTGVKLAPSTVIMSKCTFEYKITVGKTYSENSAFVLWAESNPTKVKLTRRCKRDMLKPLCHGGSHFYLTGDNVLLVAKMHLGSSISKIERITKK